MVIRPACTLIICFVSTVPRAREKACSTCILLEDANYCPVYTCLFPKHPVKWRLSPIKEIHSGETSNIYSALTNVNSKAKICTHQHQLTLENKLNVFTCVNYLFYSYIFQMSPFVQWPQRCPGQPACRTLHPATQAGWGCKAHNPPDSSLPYRPITHIQQESSDSLGMHLLTGILLYKQDQSNSSTVYFLAVV